MFKYFGISDKSAPAEQNSAGSEELRALPASWYRSPGMYELERRAIFSKKWILITHMLRFTKSGDYISVTQAGFPFFLIKDRDGNINGFHNVCRHRAFPIIEKDAGNTSILCCKYHGWSYGLKGNLAKAPRFDTVEGFDKTQQSLYPVNVHVDKMGFIWVNLEAGKPTVAWDDDFAEVDAQPRFAQFNPSNYHYDHSWTMDGDYNWKTLADNYNECYHCSTGHPASNATSDLANYYVETKGGHIQHFNINKNKTDTTMELASSFLFPNACFTIAPDFFYLMRCIPVSAGVTHMEYDVFRHNNSTEEDFTRISEFFKQVLREDKDLCNGAQKNLNGGIFVNGALHPEKESGPVFFQKTVRDLVMEHKKREESEGKEIWPATPARTDAMKTKKCAEEECLCAELDKSAAMDAKNDLAHEVF